MGKLLAQITRGRPEALEVRFLGQFEKDPEPIASAVAKGLLARVLGEGAVNLVSARPLLKDRGIHLTTLRSEEAGSTPGSWRPGSPPTRRSGGPGGGDRGKAPPRGH